MVSAVETMHVGTDTGLVSLVTAGGEWRITATHLAGKQVVGVATAGRNSAIVYVAVQGHGLYKTVDQGATWQQVLAANAHTLLMDQGHAERLWVGVEPPGIYRTQDGGQTWQDLSAAVRAEPTAIDWSYPEPPYQARISTLAQVPGKGTTLLAGVVLGDLIRSEDAGNSWQLAEGEPGEGVHQLSHSPSEPDFWLAATEDGVYCSVDRGRKWAEASEGIVETWATSVMVLPGGICLAVAANSAPGVWVENATSTLYRSTDRAQSWQPVPLSGTGYVTIFATGLGDTKNPFLGTQEGVIYAGSDDGKGWVEIADLRTGINCILVTDGF